MTEHFRKVAMTSSPPLEEVKSVLKKGAYSTKVFYIPPKFDKHIGFLLNLARPKACLRN